MEDRIEISLLMDCYGSMLTEKQFKVMNLYYNDDLSLAEIAELENTSRQAIHDLIKRCYKQIISYENKLSLLKKTLEKEKKVINLLNEIKHKYSLDDTDYLKYRNMLEDL